MKALPPETVHVFTDDECSYWATMKPAHNVEPPDYFGWAEREGQRSQRMAYIARYLLSIRCEISRYQRGHSGQRGRG